MSGLPQSGHGWAIYEYTGMSRPVGPTVVDAEFQALIEPARHRPVARRRYTSAFGTQQINPRPQLQNIGLHGGEEGFELVGHSFQFVECSLDS